MERASGDFVKSLKEKIDLRKKVKNYERNLLSDSMDYLINCLKENPCFELVSLKNFKTNQLSSIANILVKGKNPIQQIENFLNSKKLFCEFQKIESNISVCCLDLSGKIVGYREKPNITILQVYLKNSEIAEIKLFLKSEDPVFSVYESNYFFLKLWLFESGIFNCKKIEILSKDRDKIEADYPIDEKNDLRLTFHETGEISQINILVKKGEK